MANADLGVTTFHLPEPAPREMQFDRRAWQVPSENRALEGWVEGAPTAAMRAEAMERARRERASWRPDAEAWQQLVQLHAFIGKRVRIQFWDPGTMYMLNEDEWPHRVEADCVGVTTLVEDGHLQPFLFLRGPTEIKTGGSSGMSHLRKRGAFSYHLAPVADLYEITSLGENE